ncbi:MAG: hypothetical protein GTO08_06975, partial [Deltaproteobacteria bacterium]|nr:hypothetical protein [Deltaproteobacteria bacterium]
MSIKPEAGLMRKIPAGYVKKFEALPCTFEGNGRVLVVSTKTPRHIIDEMMRITGIGKYDTMPPKDVQKLIDEAYDTLSGPTDPPEAAPTDTCDGEPSSMIEVEGYPMKDCDEGSITQFVDSMFERTIRLKASDMHLEPHEKEFVVRNRIDGVLHNVVNLPRELHAPVIARVKAMAGLDIAEKRLPQDGRINVSIGGSATDMQVSIVPTSFGERAVLRVRNRTGILGEVAHYFKKLFDEEASTPPTEESPLAREGNVEDVLRESFSPDSPAGKPGFAPPQPSANDAGTTPPSAPEKQRDRADPGKEIVSQIVQKNIFRSRYLRPEEQKSAALSSVKGMLRKW